MNIIDAFSEIELELLHNINIEIQDREYGQEEIKTLTQKIYNNGYMNVEISYADAEKYMNMYERLQCLTKINIEKVKKYTKKEFDDDYYLCTVIMHKAVWNNPNRINQLRKNKNEKLLTGEERQKLQREFEENANKLSDYTKYLEEKYGGNLSDIDKYFNTLKNK